jgi:hypothetical protein
MCRFEKVRIWEENLIRRDPERNGKWRAKSIYRFERNYGLTMPSDWPHHYQVEGMTCTVHYRCRKANAKNERVRRIVLGALIMTNVKDYKYPRWATPEPRSPEQTISGTATPPRYGDDDLHGEGYLPSGSVTPAAPRSPTEAGPSNRALFLPHSPTPQSNGPHSSRATSIAPPLPDLPPVTLPFPAVSRSRLGAGPRSAGSYIVSMGASDVRSTQGLADGRTSRASSYHGPSSVSSSAMIYGGRSLQANPASPNLHFGDWSFVDIGDETHKSE